jgi:hypothetical protein
MPAAAPHQAIEDGPVGAPSTEKQESRLAETTVVVCYANTIGYGFLHVGFSGTGSLSAM